MSISKLNTLNIKGGLPTTKQSTVNPPPSHTILDCIVLETYGDCIPAGPVSSRY